ncbi:hypothetical protein [Salsuginibacillus kocurii]|uniref:hypothetical protein n=1 Tax=Salsuginibacillus kocurii TaxID=427078 RepID=UPI000362B2F8|nr:hypothetical protein [Salsuginibacillus kocurii]
MNSITLEPSFGPVQFLVVVTALGGLFFICVRWLLRLVRRREKDMFRSRLAKESRLFVAGVGLALKKHTHQLRELRTGLETIFALICLVTMSWSINLLHGAAIIVLLVMLLLFFAGLSWLFLHTERKKRAIERTFIEDNFQPDERLPAGRKGWYEQKMKAYLDVRTIEPMQAYYYLLFLYEVHQYEHIE